MKQADLAMLILIVSFSLVTSYFIGNALFGGETNRSTEVEKVEPISADFPQPDATVFNEDAINLTETINIGESSSASPFTSGN